MKTVTFTVYGRPLPKGSAKAFVIKGTNRAVVTSDTKGLKGWEALIRQAALDLRVEVDEGPISVGIHFYLPRPKYLAKRATPPHIIRPDCDKLVRASLDPLTGVLFKDDSQVVTLVASKHYAEVDGLPRAVFYVRQGNVLEGER